MMVRLRQEGAKLERTVQLALTCGEETTDAFNAAVAPTARESCSSRTSRLVRRRFRTIGWRRRTWGRDRTSHSLLRTTCVATLLEGGHANHALPQHAEANVNCRIFPGNTVEATQAALLGDLLRRLVQLPAPPQRHPLRHSR
ncbi:peptidase dimerization domain-containing protein [Archangium sp.]|jgi:hypothetical protein|uniref:peptidase dimerization domain-containing protein n=1 Tax=Archangium sp. TaxID=1872627 RepID=UPI0039C8B464